MFLKLFEAIRDENDQEKFNRTLKNVNDEYSKKFATIPRDKFDELVKLDPATKLEEDPSGELQGTQITFIGPNVKQLVLPKYNTEKNFIDTHIDELGQALQSYVTNRSNLPTQYRNIANFPSVEQFINFINNPEDSDSTIEIQAKAEKNPLDVAYNKYYSSIPRETFDTIIDLDLQTTDEKIGEVAKNLLLPKYIAGETSFLEKPERVARAIRRFYDDRDTYETAKQSVDGYKSVEEFITYIPVSPTIAALSAEGCELTPGVDYKLIASSRDYDVFRMLTYKGNHRIAHARGAANVWCTAGGANGNNFGANATQDQQSSYWKSYHTERGAEIYQFIHKTAPTDRTKNFNMAFRERDKQVIEFRNGNNEGTSSSNSMQNTTWKNFLIANLPLVKSLIDCDDPLSEDEMLQTIAASLKYEDQPMIIKSISDLYFLFDKEKKDIVKNSVRELQIYNIKTIPFGLFSDLPALKKLTIGTGIEAIGNQAFYNCNTLVDVILNEGLKVIGEEAFAGCTALSRTIRIPNSVEVIKKNAFEGAHCNLSVKRDREQLGLKLQIDVGSEKEQKWYLKHLKGVQE